MLIESNRLHQKIKKLKEELAKEKELRKEAEKQLRMLRESVTTSSTIGRSQVLEITKPTNIGLVIGTPMCENLSETEYLPRRAVHTKQTESIENESPVDCPESEEMWNFLADLAKSIEEQRTSEIDKGYKDYFSRDIINLNLSEIKKNVKPRNLLFQMLYKELFHRHNRITEWNNEDSWRNYQELFSALPSHLFLPDIWLLDIIKEFGLRFQNEPICSTTSVWNMDSVIGSFSSLFSNPSSFKLQQFSLIALLQLHIFSENHVALSELLNGLQINVEKNHDLDIEVSVMICYEIGFAYLVAGKCSDAASYFLDVMNQLKNAAIGSSRIANPEEYTQKAQRCLAFCVSNNTKIQKTLPKCVATMIETTHKLDIEEWKDGKVETFWNFFSECSPYICRRESWASPEWKTQNLKSIKFCIQRVTTWKPMRNLKGLLRICDLLPLEFVPKSIMPVTTESDIIFFCDNNNGLLRLVNSKSSGIEKVLRDFPNIHKKETLTLLIMQYHKILRKQRNDEKVLAFGRKFVNVLKTIGYSKKVTVEDAMCYIREVSKISMEAANKLVEDHCKS